MVATCIARLSHQHDGQGIMHAMGHDADDNAPVYSQLVHTWAIALPYIEIVQLAVLLQSRAPALLPGLPLGCLGCCLLPRPTTQAKLRFRILANMASLEDREDELTCPVCLDLFTSPVVLFCVYHARVFIRCFRLFPAMRSTSYAPCAWWLSMRFILSTCSCAAIIKPSTRLSKAAWRLGRAAA